MKTRHQIGSGRPWRLWTQNCTAALLLMLLASPAVRAQDSFDGAAQLMKETVQRIIVPKSVLTDSPQVRSAFREVVAEPSRWTCRVLADGEQVALGTLVATDGWILTKASQLHGNLTVRLHNGRQLRAEQVKADEEYDLALLKVPAKGLPVARWADDSETQVGQWAVTPGTGRDPIAIGVVSVLARPIAKPSGILGIVLEEGDAGPLIVHVLPDSGAAHAGLQVGDIVTHCNDTRTESREKLIETVRQFSPGDELKLRVRRDGEPLRIAATLTSEPINPMLRRREIQNSMGSELSERRSGFPLALQHDTVLRPSDCGGPLVNLDGEMLGINVARAGRTESFAIPAGEVKQVVERLRR